MSILEKQINSVLEKAQKDLLKQGKFVSIERLADLLKNKIANLNGGTTLVPPTFQRKEQFDLNKINKSFESIDFDLKIAYEIISEYFENLLKNYIKSDASYKAQRAQLKKINSALNELLFLNKEGEDYFFGVFDDFSDLTKIDLFKSPESSINLAEGLIELPYNWPSTKKVDLSHLFNINDGLVKSRSLDGTKIFSSLGYQSRTATLFDDMDTIWNYIVKTATDKGAEIEITFPVSSDDSIERITKVEITGYGGSETLVDLRTSLDNINFTRPHETNQISIDVETEKVSWDFPDTGVKWVKLILTKNYPDYRADDTPKVLSNPLNQETQVSSGKFNWVYAFSVKNISLYQIGRSQDTVVCSKPLKPINSPSSPINKVGLYVDELIVKDSSIEYEVALSNKEGTSIGNFFPIAPAERLVSDIPRVINLNQASGVYIESNLTGIVSGDIVTNKYINYYPVMNITSGDYVFGTNSVYIGEDLWLQNKNPREIDKTIKGNYLNFSDGNRTKDLYYFTEEPANVNYYVGGNSNYFTSLKVQGSIVRSLKPAREINVDPNPGLDAEPDYAVESVSHIKSISSVEEYSIAPSGGSVLINGINIPVASVWSNISNNATGSTSGNVRYPSIGVPIVYEGQLVEVNPGSVSLSYVSGSSNIAFRNGIDYSIKRSDDPFFSLFPGWSSLPLHWRIVGSETAIANIVSGSNLYNQLGRVTGQVPLNYSNFPPSIINGVTIPNNASLKISYELDSDITHRVLTISYDTNEILLDSLINISPGDSIIVKYKKKPTNINRSVVIVKQKQSSANPGTIYKEGVDYTLDVINGKITALLNGDIVNSSSKTVYVDYDFRTKIQETLTYSIWCYFGSNQAKELKYSSLNLRTNLGEGMWISSYNGKEYTTKRIDNNTSIILTKGWHFFNVKSLDPALFQDAAILKVLKLRDISGKYVFISSSNGNVFFERMTGMRASLGEVDYSYLINGVPSSDKSKFSIKNNKIYLNFNPLTSDIFLLKRLSNVGTIENVTNFNIKFEGRLKSQSSIEKDHIILRMRLSRSSGSSSGVTPKLYSYNLRIGY